MHTLQQLLPALRRAASTVISRSSAADPEQTLTGIVRMAVETVPGVDAGGVTMTTEDGEVSSRASTCEAVADLDQLQSDWYEGPCISALEDPPGSGMFVVDDLGSRDRRWPGFASYARDAEYHGFLSLQLGTSGGVSAALNLYATNPGTFTSDACMTASVFGLQAARALDISLTGDSVRWTAAGHDVVQAQGVLMERFTVDDHIAFHVLVSACAESDIQLLDAARSLCAEAIDRGRSRPVTADAPEHQSQVVPAPQR